MRFHERHKRSQIGNTLPCLPSLCLSHYLDPKPFTPSHPLTHPLTSPHPLVFEGLFLCYSFLCVCALTSQNVSDNDLGIDGARIISDFLQENNSSLWKLKLSGEPTGGEGRG